MELDNITSIYFIGIGGIGMSAAAAIAKHRGFEVRGSDGKSFYDPAKKAVEDAGITTYIGYDKQHIIDHPSDLYVVSAGEDLHNPEVAYLEEQGIHYISFPELLYDIAENSIRIVVTGTHGKSTTTGVLGFLLSKIDDSSFMVGGVLQQTETNFHAGTGHYYVFEGDEYKALWNDPTPKLALYKADALLLTNLEYDHPDVYANLEEIKAEFKLAINNLPDDGIVVYNIDNAHLTDLAYHDNKPAFGFGKHEDAVFRLIEKKVEDGKMLLTVENKLDKENVRIEEYETSLIGDMNAYNVVGAVALLRVLGFSSEVIRHYLPEFKGIKRRFEIIKEQPYIVVDDYAHHPTAVSETLKAAKLRYPGKKIWAVFEPHTFSRTEATKDLLVKSFEDANEVLLSEIYPAREHWHEGMITIAQVAEEIKKQYPEIRLRTVRDKEEAKAILEKECKPEDVVIVMAVGSFNKLSYEL